MASRNGKPNIDESDIDAFLGALAAGLPPLKAASITGYSREAFLARRRKDAAFAVRWDATVMQTILRHIKTIEDAGKKDWRATAWLLERRWPEMFARPECQEDIEIGMGAARKADVEAATSEKVARTKMLLAGTDPDAVANDEAKIRAIAEGIMALRPRATDQPAKDGGDETP